MFKFNDLFMLAVLAELQYQQEPAWPRWREALRACWNCSRQLAAAVGPRRVQEKSRGARQPSGRREKTNKLISARKGGNSSHLITDKLFWILWVYQTVLHFYFVFLILYLRKMTLSFLPDCIIVNDHLMFTNAKVSCTFIFFNTGISLKL